MIKRSNGQRDFHLCILEEIQKDLERMNIQPEEFKGRIIFMSMFSYIDWSERKNDENCISNAEKVKNFSMKFSQGHWTFLVLSRKKSGMEVLLSLKKENGIPQPAKWYSDSKKLVTLWSKVSVP